jgi:hypothetical protein
MEKTPGVSGGDACIRGTRHTNVTAKVDEVRRVLERGLRDVRDQLRRFNASVKERAAGIIKDRLAQRTTNRIASRNRDPAKNFDGPRRRRAWRGDSISAGVVF